MAKFYEKNVINELIDSVPFEKVMHHYGYPYKGSGKNLGSECPECGKDHDHFKINTHKNLANCFVCGFSCNTIQFIQKLDSTNFIAAVETLAEIGAFTLPETTKKKRSFSVIDRIMYYAVDFYKENDSTYPFERGIDQETVNKYKVGYAPGGTALLSFLKEKGFKENDIKESGLIVERQGRLMDFFYKCVIFPVIQNGIVVDIYGRHIGNSKTKHVYLKGEFLLFNIDNINGQKPVIYVESIINALSIISTGYTNVVAIGGASKFSKQHMSHLKAKGVKSMINGYDTGDVSGAGQEGAISSGKLIEQSGVSHRIMNLPENTDINEMITSENGIDKFKVTLLNSTGTDEFELRYRLSKKSTSWIESYLRERVQ